MLNWFKAPSGKEEMASVETDERVGIRFGLTILVVGFGGFLLWASLAPLDEGVPTPGVVAVESKRKTVQHLTGGIVEKILAKEGQAVKEGDVLVKLNDTKIHAERGIARNEYLTNLAVQARLAAERDGARKLAFPTELMQEAGERSAITQVMALQVKLFETRRGALEGEIGILNENISSLHEQINGFNALQQAKETQLKLLEQEADGMRSLVKEGYVPRNKLFEVERNIASLQGSRSEDLANLARAKSSIAELKLRILQRTQEFRKDVESQLTDVQKNVASLRDRLNALEEELRRSDIRSPVEGVVVGLAIHTEGGVIAPGAKIMDIVPKGDTLVVETQIPTHLIDKVKRGLPADVHFTALSRTATPVVVGKLDTISADRLEDPTGRVPPYYSARVVVSPDEMTKLGDQEVRPGMPVDVVIKTGERTFLNYLMKPLVDRVHLSFTEK